MINVGCTAGQLRHRSPSPTKVRQLEPKSHCTVFLSARLLCLFRKISKISFLPLYVYDLHVGFFCMNNYI